VDADAHQIKYRIPYSIPDFVAKPVRLLSNPGVLSSGQKQWMASVDGCDVLTIFV
jgi:hypothetical protein